MEDANQTPADGHAPERSPVNLEAIVADCQQWLYPDASTLRLVGHIRDLIAENERLKEQLRPHIEDPGGYLAVGGIVQRAREAEAARDKLQTFKDYVHARLDAAGVTVDPESSHKAEGCRIGGRLDEVFAERDWLRVRVAELEKALRGGQAAIVGKAEQQEAFAGPQYTQHTDANREAFRHAAKRLRDAAKLLVIPATQPLNYEQLGPALQAAIAAVLARVGPSETPTPVVINGEIAGLLQHDGHPETATGFRVQLGSGPPPGWMPAPIALVEQDDAA